ncbi:MAG: helix-turn-helix domain-containing protein [Gracilibacteraceae bacterium]|jgi:AraC-like DNA-binding protein|nr:helix-turn-helix domain-containing protein [Gracilibacteraceae bacterium]
MPEYMSVREAAEKWSLSERRVHRLCKDGRVAGLIRFGRSWGIPRGAEKPGDARKPASRPPETRGSESGRGAAADLLGPDARLLARSGTCAVFQVENETGDGIVTVYDVFPGVRLMYNDLHLARVTERDSFYVPPSANMLVVNHCREGRFECEFPWGEYGYVGEGDMAVSTLPTPVKSSSYPLAHYHGISVVADIPRAAKTVGEVSALLGTVSLDVQEIKERLLGKHPYFLMRSSEAVSHIFSELYNAPDALRDSYIRLKLIELFLFLSVIRPDDDSGRKYFYKTRVTTVKAIRDHMTAHLDRQFTLDELSRRFNIPLTAMKSCFKSLFGTPIQAYMREYRLQTASALLRGTDEHIGEIAAKVGYDSPARFSAVFRAAVGLTPSDYRKVSVQKQ